MAENEDGATVDVDAEQVSDETVEQPQENEEVSSEDEQAQDSPPENEDDPKAKPDGVQKRINKLTKQLREQQRENDYLKQLNDSRSQKTPDKPDTAAPEEFKSLEDFNWDDQAYSKYMRETIKEQTLAEVRKDQQHEQTARRDSDWRAKESDYADKHDDYYEVTRNPDITLTREMFEIIQESDNGPEILRYICKNPSIASNLAGKTNIQIATKIGNLENKLQDIKQTKSATKAPAPAKKISGASASKTITAGSPDSDKLSDDEWLKRRRKEIEARNK